MKRNSIASLLLVASLGMSGVATGVIAGSAAAGGPPARAFGMSGSVISVNTPVHQFVVLSGTTRYVLMTTTQSRFTLDAKNASFNVLRPGQLVTARGNFRARYRVAAMIQLRTPTPIPISTAPTTANLTSALTNALSQERYALATYQNVVSKLGATAPFSNIIPSETQHVAVITALMTNHGIAVPTPTVPGAVAPATRNAACQLGVTVETALIAMYQNGITLAKDFPDVVRAFSNLLDASQSSHLPAFVRCS
ncbi:MAG: ferritin family protein [Acidimicrobiales bacterium]